MDFPQLFLFLPRDISTDFENKYLRRRIEHCKLGIRMTPVLMNDNSIFENSTNFNTYSTPYLKI